MLGALCFLAFEFRWFSASPSIREALELNYFGASIPIEVLQILWWVTLAAWFVGGFAFLLFLPWSRWLLAGLIALEIVLTPFQGLYVSTGLYAAISFAASVCLLVPLVLSFFAPCDAYFRAPSNHGLERPGDPATGAPGAQPGR